MLWKWLNRLRFNVKQPRDAKDGGSWFSIADTGKSLARDDKRPGAGIQDLVPNPCFRHKPVIDIIFILANNWLALLRHGICGLVRKYRRISST